MEGASVLVLLNRWVGSSLSFVLHFSHDVRSATLAAASREQGYVVISAHNTLESAIIILVMEVERVSVKGLA